MRCGIEEELIIDSDAGYLCYVLIIVATCTIGTIIASAQQLKMPKEKLNEVFRESFMTSQDLIAIALPITDWLSFIAFGA